MASEAERISDLVLSYKAAASDEDRQDRSLKSKTEQLRQFYLALQSRAKYVLAPRGDVALTIVPLEATEKMLSSSP